MTSFTTAEDLTLHGQDYVRVRAAEIRRVVSLPTSGSTGPRKRLYFTDGDLRRTVDFFRDGMAHICRSGAKAAILLGNTAPDGLGDLLARGLAELGAEPLLIGFPEEEAAVQEALRAFRPDTVIGMPVSTRRLLRAIPDLIPESVLLSGDYVADSVVRSIARNGATSVYAHYGLTESGLGFAVQCAPGSGYHVRRDELSVEIIDPETGRSLPDGLWGELVFTTLRREAMPLTRYRTGDLCRILPGPCACGRPGPVLDRVAGRLSELKKPVSMPFLEERLLMPDGLTDFSASLSHEVLLLTVLPEEAELAQTLLKTVSLPVPCEVRTGLLPLCAGKRGVEITVP